MALQLIVSVTVATGQPAWVQLEENLLNPPAPGWVTAAWPRGEDLACADGDLAGLG